MRDQILETWDHRDVMQSKRIQASLEGATVVIWSGQHNGFWRPHGMGYTLDLMQAGRFSFEEAFKNTSTAGPETKLKFEVVKRGRR